MPGTVWQKSSFSGSGGSGECIELAASAEAIRLRESQDPAVVLVAPRSRVAGLLRTVKNGRFSGLSEDPLHAD